MEFTEQDLGNFLNAGSAITPRFQNRIRQELQAIHQLDGSINSVEDILKMDTAPLFREAVQRGCSFLEAFQLANFDAVKNAQRQEAAQRAAQAAINSARSKEHLYPTSSQISSVLSVPTEVMEIYRELLPQAKTADISSHYNRVMREIKNKK